MNRVKLAALNVGVSVVVLFCASLVGALAIVARISDRMDRRALREFHRRG